MDIMCPFCGYKGLPVVTKEKTVIWKVLFICTFPVSYIVSMETGDPSTWWRRAPLFRALRPTFEVEIRKCPDCGMRIGSPQPVKW